MILTKCTKYSMYFWCRIHRKILYNEYGHFLKSTKSNVLLLSLPPGFMSFHPAVFYVDIIHLKVYNKLKNVFWGKENVEFKKCKN